MADFLSKDVHGREFFYPLREKVEKIPLKTLVGMVMDGKIPDSKTQIAILKSEKILADRKSK